MHQDHPAQRFSWLPFLLCAKPILIRQNREPGDVQDRNGGVLAPDPATRQPRACLHGDGAGPERSAEQATSPQPLM